MAQYVPVLGLFANKIFMLLSRNMEQIILLFDSHEQYKYLRLRISRAQIISVFTIWSLEIMSVKLGSFLTVSFSRLLYFSHDLTKLMVLPGAGHLA